MVNELLRKELGAGAPSVLRVSETQTSSKESVKKEREHKMKKEQGTKDKFCLSHFSLQQLSLKNIPQPPKLQKLLSSIFIYRRLISIPHSPSPSRSNQIHQNRSTTQSVRGQ